MRGKYSSEEVFFMKPQSIGMKALMEINERGHLIANNGMTHIGKGVDLNNLSKELDIYIKDSDRSGHFGCFGTTRVGKTRLIENIIEQDIRKGYNVVVIDPKGDSELFSKIVQVAAESGRLGDLMMLTPIFPEHSIMLDPLSHYYMEEELVDHVISGIKAKEDYFIAIASEVTQAVISGLGLLAKSRKRDSDISKDGRMTINFLDVKNRSDYQNLRKFKESIAPLPGSEDLLMSLDQILNSPPDFFAKVSSSLRTTLSALTSGTTGQVIGKCKVNEFVTRFEDGKGVILICNTGSMLSRRTAHIIGRVLISMIQSMIGRVLASGNKLYPPLCVHVDEGHNILYTGIQDLFAKGGGANVWVHLYTQSIAQIQGKLARKPLRASWIISIPGCLCS